MLRRGLAKLSLCDAIAFATLGGNASLTTPGSSITLNERYGPRIRDGGRYDEGLRFASNKLHILDYSLNGARFREQSDSVQAAVHSIVFRDSALFDRCSFPPQ